jgi:L-fucose mutarotase
VLAEMGHGDEILLADVHYPGHTFANRILRADGVDILDLLDGILPLFELDSYSDSPVIMMAPVEGDQLDPKVAASYREKIDKHAPNTADFELVERFDFYDRSKECYAIVMTGSTAKYGNIILKKGVTPVV